MNDPQVWTLIAVFVGLQALVLRQISALDNKYDAQFSALREEMRARFEQVDRRFEQVDRRFEQVETTLTARIDHLAAIMDVRFGALEHRVAALDDDMKLVKAHLIPPAA